MTEKPKQKSKPDQSNLVLEKPTGRVIRNIRNIRQEAREAARKVSLEANEAKKTALIITQKASEICNTEIDIAAAMQLAVQKMRAKLGDDGVKKIVNNLEVNAEEKENETDENAALDVIIESVMNMILPEITFGRDLKQQILDRSEEVISQLSNKYPESIIEFVEVGKLKSEFVEYIVETIQAQKEFEILNNAESYVSKLLVKLDSKVTFKSQLSFIEKKLINRLVKRGLEKKHAYYVVKNAISKHLYGLEYNPKNENALVEALKIYAEYLMKNPEGLRSGLGAYIVKNVLRSIGPMALSVEGMWSIPIFTIINNLLPTIPDAIGKRQTGKAVLKIQFELTKEALEALLNANKSDTQIPPGQMHQIIQSANQSIANIINEISCNVIPSIAQLVTIISMLYYIGPLFLGSAVLAIPVGYALRKVSKDLSTKLATEMKNSSELAAAAMAESLQNLSQFQNPKANGTFKELIALQAEAQRKNYDNALWQTLIDLLGQVQYLIATFSGVGVGVVTDNPKLDTTGKMFGNIINSHTFVSLIEQMLRLSTQFISDVNNIRVYQEMIADLKTPPANEGDTITPANELRNKPIKVENYLTKEGNEINFEIPAGSFVVLTGSSGSGKSTLLNEMMGIASSNNPNTHVYYGDVELNQNSNQRAEIRENIGIVPQRPPYFEQLTFRENLCMYNKNATDEQIEKLLKLFGLGDLMYRVKDPLGRDTTDKNTPPSGGQMAKIGLIRQLLSDPFPSYLALDEFTTGVDKDFLPEMYKILAKIKQEHPKLTIFLISHDEKLLELLQTNKIECYQLDVQTGERTLLVIDPEKQKTRFQDLLTKSLNNQLIESRHGKLQESDLHKQKINFEFIKYFWKETMSSIMLETPYSSLPYLISFIENFIRLRDVEEAFKETMFMQQSIEDIAKIKNPYQDGRNHKSICTDVALRMLKEIDSKKAELKEKVNQAIAEGKIEGLKIEYIGEPYFVKFINESSKYRNQHSAIMWQFRMNISPKGQEPLYKKYFMIFDPNIEITEPIIFEEGHNSTTYTSKYNPNKLVEVKYNKREEKYLLFDVGGGLGTNICSFDPYTPDNDPENVMRSQFSHTDWFSSSIRDVEGRIPMSLVFQVSTGRVILNYLESEEQFEKFNTGSKDDVRSRIDVHLGDDMEENKIIIDEIKAKLKTTANLLATNNLYPRNNYLTERGIEQLLDDLLTVFENKDAYLELDRLNGSKIPA
jgi:ABC-type multidrug transport system fused ATPase/permease subunit